MHSPKAHIYKYQNIEMKFLHNPDLRLHSLHVKDAARALVCAANWVAPISRNEANKLAGEEIPAASTWLSGKEHEQELVNMRQASTLMNEEQVVVAPYFNIVSGVISRNEELNRSQDG